MLGLVLFPVVVENWYYLQIGDLVFLALSMVFQRSIILV